ncbi:MAG: hypothetical protein WCP31_12870, partial [Chloroflexales bacterium]
MLEPDRTLAIRPAFPPTQLLLPGFDGHWESSLYHAPERDGYFTLAQSRGSTWREWYYLNSQLAWAMGKLDASADSYISQNTFYAQTRRMIHVLHIAGAYQDLDFYKYPDSPLAKLPSDEARVRHVVSVFEDAGKPLPSVINSSGRGLQMKFLFSGTIPRAAKPRWDSLQLHLRTLLDEHQLCPDVQAVDVSRVYRVVGTVNSRADGAVCRVLWVNGTENCVKTYTFDELCDAFLPWTRDEVRAFRAQQAIWDANRAAGRAVRGVRAVTAVDAAICDDLGRQLWFDRLNDIRVLVRLRHGEGHGVPAGLRNNTFWVAALALAHS